MKDFRLRIFEWKDSRHKYALSALLTFLFSVLLFIYGLLTLGVFSKDKIVVTTLATTGPDFQVVLGWLKLKMQMPDSVDNSDVSGVMVTEQSENDLDAYLEKHYSAYGDYFVLTENIVGAKQSDSSSFHPLIEITAWQHIDKLIFWVLAIGDISMFLLFGLFYEKYKG